MRGEGKEVFGVRLGVKDKGGFEMWHKMGLDYNHGRHRD